MNESMCCLGPSDANAWTMSDSEVDLVRPALPPRRCRIAARRQNDGVDRHTPTLEADFDTYDLKGRLNAALGRHSLVLGGGYRLTDDILKVANRASGFFDPEEESITIVNAFVQDAIALTDNLTLTLGVKYEHSSLGGGDILPTVRAGWRLQENHFVWAAVSRAVRSPSRLDRDVVIPGSFERAVGFDSEEVIAYEVGYRGQPHERASLSVSLYYNQYDDLRVTARAPSGLSVLDNLMSGEGYGAEAWAEVQVTPWWRLSPGVNVLRKRLKLEPGAVTASLASHQGNDPDFQAQLRSRMDLKDDVTFDAGLRAVDDLRDPKVPGYVEVDARLGWQVNDSLELSITGTNLMSAHHPETGAAATRGEVRRSVILGARLVF